ncbi:MAG: hypothetical protein SFZ23_07820 [Planctomycetota bacterium]|nr:hypothetical protein [Planctomycetota bacterium]
MRRVVGRWTLILGLVPITAAAPGLAQCVGEWVAAPESFNWTPLALASWDPDASGPHPPLLISGGTSYAGGATHLGAWDGLIWSYLGTGPGTNNRVHSLTVDGNNHLIIGGSFETIDALPAAGVARFDGFNWHALGSGLGWSIGPGYGTANALATLPGGDIVVGGWWLDSAGGVPVQGVARWNGSSWNAMGAGLSQVAPPWGNQANIWNFVSTSQGLVALGGIGFSGPTSLADVAIWNGFAWQPPPRNGPNASIAIPGYSAMAGAELPDGRLVVGTSDGVYWWSGLQWLPLGEELVGTKHCMLVLPNGDLVVGGESLSVGDYSVIEFGPIARWNGSAWQRMTLDETTHGGRVFALTMHAGDLFVGGGFRLGRSAISNESLARWREGAALSLVSNPADAVARPGELVQFSIQVSGEGVPSCQWQIETQPGVWEILGPSPASLACGGRAYASGSYTQPDISITVEGCTQTQRVRCVLLRSCGSITSEPALLFLCPADFNVDGTADFFDYLDFVAAYSSEDPAADFNRDGVVDFFDYLDFVAELDRGC